MFVFRNKDVNMDVVVESFGSKGIQLDGFYYGRGSLLYYFILGQNGVYCWDMLKNIKEVLVKNIIIEWVDFLGMDGKGFCGLYLMIYISILEMELYLVNLIILYGKFMLEKKDIWIFLREVLFLVVKKWD